jgi:(1->4)-alpha-D-glucan 1-alpha-D-glucosylmutase
LVHRTLKVRARRPGSFGEGRSGAYKPLFGRGPAAHHVVAFSRGTNVVSVVTRWPLALARGGGWGRTSLALPPGDWLDVLGGRQWRGTVPLAEILAGLPVALLERIRTERASAGQHRPVDAGPEKRQD